MVAKRNVIAVTERHITKSLPESSAKCMVAEAVKESIPGARNVHVDIQTIRYTDQDGVRRTFLTPAVPQSALCRFDAGDPVAPFTFRLPDPMHISKPTRHTRQGAARAKTVVSARNATARVRVGGRGVPILGSSTRRRFGIRNLRINQEGQVVQIGTEQAY